MPGQPLVVDGSAVGFPYASIDDLPPDDYRVQVLVNRYTEFRRADGHVLWMHNDQWEGHQPFRSPGNLYIYTGDMDSFFLESAVMLLEEFLESTTDPYYAGSVAYGDRQPHCWGPRGSKLMDLIDAHLMDTAPAGADMESWRY